MLTTDHLPQAEKNILRFEEWRRVILLLTVLIGSVLTIGLVLLVPSFLPLYFQGQELSRGLEAQKKAFALVDTAHISDTMRALKQTIPDLKASVSQESKAYETLNTLAPQMEGIAISNVSVNKTGDIAIQGKAATRDNLLKFEERLRESGKFQKIFTPLSNIIRETNISFSLQGKLKSQYAFSL